MSITKQHHECMVSFLWCHQALLNTLNLLKKLELLTCGTCHSSVLHCHSSALPPLLLYMSRFANNALLGGGVRVRVWIREQRKIKRRSKALLSLCWQSWTSHTSSRKLQTSCVYWYSCWVVPGDHWTYTGSLSLAFPSGFMVLVCGFDYHLQSTGVCLEGFGFKHCSEIHRYVCNQCVISMHIHIP